MNWIDEVLQEHGFGGKLPSLQSFVLKHQDNTDVIEVDVAMLQAVFEHDNEVTAELLKHQVEVEEQVKKYTAVKDLSRDAVHVLSELVVLNEILIKRETSAYYFLKSLLRDAHVLDPG